MGFAWQQGPFGQNPSGRFLLEQPLPNHVLYAEPAGRRMRVGLAGATLARGLVATGAHGLAASAKRVSREVPYARHKFVRAGLAPG